MYTPATSRHFTKHYDPVSQMPYYILSTHVAPVQQCFYFVNSGLSDDGRYFWFYCAFPPASGHYLGVVDFLTDEVRYFTDTAAYDATWMIEPQTGNAWWGCAAGYFFRTPHPEDSPVRVAAMPKEAHAGRLQNAGTHLTFSPDRKEIFVDIQFGDRSTLGSIEVATGKYTEWFQTKVGIPYNHAQFNPHNPNLVLCAHEYHMDYLTGISSAPTKTAEGIYPRLHTITRDGADTMHPPLMEYASHEWWSADGKKIYYEDGRRVIRKNLETGVHEIAVDCEHIQTDPALSNQVWHAHCTEDERYFTADASYFSFDRSWWRGCPSLVAFYNTETGKFVNIVTKNPAVSAWTPKDPCPYHIDPHPRFVLHDTWITFTTTVNGRVDAAIAPVEPLVRATR